MTTVLVTGASGFVGSALCAALRSCGHEVRAAARKTTEVESLPGERRPGRAHGTFAVGDIGPDTDWSAVLSGCDAVVHLAARVHVPSRGAARQADEFQRLNVDGTVNLARHSVRAGVGRFVFLSSVKVNGEFSAGRAFVESDPARPADAYGRSKAETEERLRNVAADTGMEVAILRPPLVYGPGVKANFLSLLRAVDAGLPLPLSSVKNLRSLVHLGNLVSAIETCMTHPSAANHTFFVSDDHDVSTPELILEIATALGRKARLFPFPPSVLQRIGRLTGRGEQVARLTESLQVDISRIKSELGWRPPFSMRQGLAQTASWYRSLRR